MIIKTFELNKIDLKKSRFFLFYGKNEGQKNELISYLTKNKEKNIISAYDEKEILDSPERFLEGIISKSLFENEKIIIIKRASDKILKTLNEIEIKNTEGVTFIIDSDILEKKSKLRNYFEKSKEFTCVPVYPDNQQTLNKIANNFLREKKINLSNENLNLILNKVNGERHHLLKELKKIEYYCKNGKKITTDKIIKLTNLEENKDISDLVDSCLVKNKKRTISILNENNFSTEDCVKIIRIFLNKSKKILNLSHAYKNNKNIELTISSAKPPIFWKDKETTKKQILIWSPENIKKLIYEISELELTIKKNLGNSINLMINFILEKCMVEPNN